MVTPKSNCVCCYVEMFFKNSEKGFRYDQRAAGPYIDTASEKGVIIAQR